MMTLEELKQISFHDRGLDSLAIDFDRRCLELMTEQEERTARFVFQDIADLTLNNLDTGPDLYEMELTTATFDALEGGRFMARMTGLQGAGRPTFSLAFSFGKVTT